MFCRLKNLLKNSAGFSFVEAILTTVVLAVGLWGGLALLHNATSHSINNDYRIIGIQLANKKLEIIIADKTFRGYDWIDESNYPTEILADPYSGFTRSITVTEVDPADFNDTQNPVADSGYKRVDVQVTWGTEPHQKIIMSTVLSSYTPS